MMYRAFTEDEQERLKDLLRKEVGDHILDSIRCDFITVSQPQFLLFDKEGKQHFVNLYSYEKGTLLRGNPEEVMLVMFNVQTQSFVNHATSMGDRDYLRMTILPRKQAQSYGIL